MAMDVRGWNSGSFTKTYQSGNREIRRITYYDKEGRVTGSVTTTRSKKPDKTKTKKLPYNFKEVSAVIIKSKTSGSARRAVALAQRKVIMLRKKRKNEDYNEQELEGAIAHAEAIERAAKKHLKNLQKEERTKRRMQSEDFEEDFFSEDSGESYDDIMKEMMQDGVTGDSLEDGMQRMVPVSYTHLRAHETGT